jgi:PKD repeat protein
MPDQAPAAEAPKGKSWLKTITGALAGLLSGAVLMYLTPLLDRVVKPAKPLANFGYQADGLTVTFQNRSTGGTSGWWDFGDGSPLEPVTPEQQVVSHSYAKPGEYTVKLSLRNLLGDENERAVLVKAEAPSNEPPSISSLEVIPVSPGSYAPATFRLVSQVKNAQLLVWDYGDDRLLDVSADKENGPVKLVTFEKPGAYVVKLAAVNGTQAVVKSDIVQVNVPPVGAVTAVLNVSDQATCLHTRTQTFRFTTDFPPGQRDNVYRFSLQSMPAPSGFELTDVQVKVTGGKVLQLQGKNELPIEPALLGLRGVRGLQLQRAADRRSVRLTGELVKESGQKVAPTLSLPVTLVMEKREPASRAAPPVTATLTVPGSAVLTLPPLPCDWVEPCRKPCVELREGGRVVWQESQLGRSAVVTLQNKRCVVTTSSPSATQVKIDIVELPAGLAPPN